MKEPLDDICAGTDIPDSSVAAPSVTVNGQVQSSRSTHDLTTTYTYDALGRCVAVTNALGQVTHAAFDAEGRTIATWGATYPVAYEYDAHGRMVAMATFRGTTEITSAADLFTPFGRMTAMRTYRGPTEITSAADHFTLSDRTTWSYDQSTGLLTNKRYADGKGTAYTNTPDGTLAAHYAYSAFGEIVAESSQSAISNPQSAVSFTHRFSTNPWCAATELSEYEYRKYSWGWGGGSAGIRLGNGKQ